MCLKNRQFTKKCGESHRYDPQACAHDRVYDEVPGGKEKAHLGAVAVKLLIIELLLLNLHELISKNIIEAMNKKEYE
jgi:hypothetical protein